MSAKGRRNRAWENKNLTGVLTPVRLYFRAFSSIPLAIILLSYVSLHATLASVPIGMIAWIPTPLVYAASFVLAVLIAVVPTIIILRKLMTNTKRAPRFLVMFFGVIAVAISSVMLWKLYAWPVMRYAPETDSGLLLFKGFIEEYRSTTLRRLPALELTETAFYAWWPMRLALVLFVINLVTATIRRIEFNFKNLGVLTVHTGIVVIALGSVFYQKFKLEGDTLLASGERIGIPGPPATVFYDREDVVLYVAQEIGWDGLPRFEQRPINKLPRYNDYNVAIGMPDESKSLTHMLSGIEHEPHVLLGSDRTLDIEPRVPSKQDGRELLVDPDIKFRIVGYTPFAELAEDWYNSPVPQGAFRANPLRMVQLFAVMPGMDIPRDKAVNTTLMPALPAERILIRPGIAIEYTMGMDETRWNDLSSTLETGFNDALVIEIPGKGFKTLVPASKGARFTLGDTGWTVGVKDILAEPPFPIITKGYQGATSSMVIVEITGPATDANEEPESFDRWVYHRFPMINQDLHPSDGGRPTRTNADPEIRVSYIDASTVQIYIDERPDGSARAIVRQPGGVVHVFNDFGDDERVNNILPNDQGGRIDLKIAQRWAHAQRIAHPAPLPEEQRDSSFGKHFKAFMAVEVSIDGDDWSDLQWIPFAQYDPQYGRQTRDYHLPDGRTVTLGFGRQQRPFPGFYISLLDFEMIAYDHRGAPRDYQSIVRVQTNTAWGDQAVKIEPYDHVVKLNNPLRAPYHWDENKAWLFNSFRRLASGMNPEQFKLSQNGWDREGWQQTQQLVDQGKLDKPRASFTILGVGNNPGIHLIALGSFFMGIGIPWAFYVKPWLLRREKARIAASHAANQQKSTA
ncbi:MAG: hypothetical protein JKY96_03405 [Phycisphaerales bacterium]|nr:hypothetical protein [Phycisphaerales bacterium]